MKETFKQTEVGLIPVDWDVQSIGQFTDCTAGGTPSTLNRMYWQGGTIPWLNSGELSKQRIFSADNYITELGLMNSSAKLVPANCVLVGLAGQGKTRGTVAINKFPFCTNQSIAAIFPNSSYCYEYLFYNLQNRYVELRSLSTGDGGRGGLNLSIIRKIELPFPPLPEQQAIAESLSDADAWIESLEALIEKKRLIKQGAMQELLRPKKGWKLKKLGQISDENIKWSFTGGPFGSNLKSFDYTNDGVRVIQLQNIGDGEFINNSEVYTSFEKADELISCNIYPGEIILSKMGDPVARACIIPENHGRYLMCSDGIRLVVNQRENDSYFICYYINSPFFRTQAENNSSGSTRKRIGLVTLRNLDLIIPDCEEQTRIAKILSAMDSEIKSLEQKLSKAHQIKHGMMQQLLTGKIRLVNKAKARSDKTLKRVIA